MSAVEHKTYQRASCGSMDLAPETWLQKETQVLVACRHGNFCHIAGRGDGKDWHIAQNGVVTPSLWWKGSCECHIYLTLEGWTPTATA